MFVIGLYDLFAYAVPGFLYSAVFGYVAARADWLSVDLKDLKDVPSLVVVLALAVVSYLLGHVTSPIGKLIDGQVLKRTKFKDARSAFLRRDPSAQGRPYMELSLALLQARAELANREVASEIHRLRAAGLMLRNSSAPLVLGFLCALVELVTGGNGLFALVFLVAFLLAAIGAYAQGLTLRLWAASRTYELCYWDADADAAPQALASGTAP